MKHHTRIILPSVGRFVYRLELMINHIDENGCDAVCPGHTGFRLEKDTDGFGWQSIPRAELNFCERWCSMCQEFMGVNEPDLCPCQYYKDMGEDPITEALQRIKEWRKTQ